VLVNVSKVLGSDGDTVSVTIPATSLREVTIERAKIVLREHSKEVTVESDADPADAIESATLLSMLVLYVVGLLAKVLAGDKAHVSGPVSLIFVVVVLGACCFPFYITWVYFRKGQLLQDATKTNKQLLRKVLLEFIPKLVRKKLKLVEEEVVADQPAGVDSDADEESSLAEPESPPNARDTEELTLPGGTGTGGGGGAVGC